MLLAELALVDKIKVMNFEIVAIVLVQTCSFNNNTLPIIFHIMSRSTKQFIPKMYTNERSSFTTKTCARVIEPIKQIPQNQIIQNHYKYHIFDICLVVIPIKCVLYDYCIVPWKGRKKRKKVVLLIPIYHIILYLYSCTNIKNEKNMEV